MKNINTKIDKFVKTIIEDSFKEISEDNKTLKIIVEKENKKIFIKFKKELVKFEEKMTNRIDSKIENEISKATHKITEELSDILDKTNIKTIVKDAGFKKFETHYRDITKDEIERRINTFVLGRKSGSEDDIKEMLKCHANFIRSLVKKQKYVIDNDGSIFK